MLKSDADTLISWQPEIRQIVERVFQRDPELQEDMVQEMNVSLIREFNNHKLPSKGLKLNAAKCDALDQLRSKYEYFPRRKQRKFELVYNYRNLCYKPNIDRYLEMLDLFDAINTLSQREITIMNLLLSGYTQREISILYNKSKPWATYMFNKIKQKLRLVLKVDNDEIHIFNDNDAQCVQRSSTRTT